MEHERMKNCPIFGNGVKCGQECAWFRQTETGEPFYLRCALIYVIKKRMEAEK